MFLTQQFQYLCCDREIDNQQQGKLVLLNRCHFSKDPSGGGMCRCAFVKVILYLKGDESKK